MSLLSDDNETSSEFLSFSSYASCKSGSLTSEPTSQVKRVQSSSRSLKWRQTMLRNALPKLVPSSKPKPVQASSEKSYIELANCFVDLIVSGPGDSLVVLFGKKFPLSDKHESKLECLSKLARPVYVFTKAANWKRAAQVLIRDIQTDGVYFVGLSWTLTRPFKLANGQPFAGDKPTILHCICKEPLNQFSGRVGPISTVVPHRKQDNKCISGIWVSLFSDQIYAEYIHELTPFESEYRQRLKAVDQAIDQVMFFVAKEGACVGMQVLNTKREEKAIRQSKQVYHHERPLIMQDGFYLVEGKFQTTFLNIPKFKSVEKNNKKVFDFKTGPKIVIIGEGTHLIRTVTEPLLKTSPKPMECKQTKICTTKTKNKVKTKNMPTSKAKENKSNLPLKDDSSKCKSNNNELGRIREVEVCLDCRFDQVTALDYSVLKHDFLFKFDSNRQ